MAKVLGRRTVSRAGEDRSALAFEVDDLAEAILDQKVIVAPNSPSTRVLVAMIEVNGAPVELMQIDHLLRKDL